MKWTRIEEAKLVRGELYLCWDGGKTYQSNNDNLPPETTHVVRILPPIDSKKIERAILKHFDIAHEYLFRDCNSRRVAHRYPRQMMWYILNQHALVSKKEMSVMYGFDRSTILYGIGMAKLDIERIDKVKQDYEAILKLIQQQ